MITESGKVFFGFILVFLPVSIFIAKKFCDRISSRASVIATGFWALVIFSMISIFLPFTYGVGMSIYDLATKPTQIAEVVSYTSEEETTRVSDTNGRSYYRTDTMYRPNLRIQDASGRMIVLPGNVRSSSMPELGSKIKVIYSPGDTTLAESSPRAMGLYAGGSLLLLILGYLLYCIIHYSFGGNMDRVSAIGINFVLYLIVPAVTLILFCVFSFYALQYFVLGNRQGSPLWFSILCVIFGMGLLPLLILYLKIFWNKLKKLSAKRAQ